MNISIKITVVTLLFIISMTSLSCHAVFGDLQPITGEVIESKENPSNLDENRQNGRLRTSRSGKFTATTEIGERNTGCCAVLTGENRVIVFETERPESVSILAEGRDADWTIYGWTADDRAILFEE